MSNDLEALRDPTLMRVAYIKILSKIGVVLDEDAFRWTMIF